MAVVTRSVGIARVLAAIAAGSTWASSVLTRAAAAASSSGSAASGSAATTISAAAIAVIAAIRIDRQVEVNVGLALSDGLQHSSLCAAASHEVELGVVDQVLELLARLPLNLHLVNVLRRKIVGSLCALGAEQEREVTQVAQTNLLALKQHLSHAIYSHVEDGADVSS